MNLVESTLPTPPTFNISEIHTATANETTTTTTAKNKNEMNRREAMLNSSRDDTDEDISKFVENIFGSSQENRNDGESGGDDNDNNYSGVEVVLDGVPKETILNLFRDDTDEDDNEDNFRNSQENRNDGDSAGGDNDERDTENVENDFLTISPAEMGKTIDSINICLRKFYISQLANYSKPYDEYVVSRLCRNDSNISKQIRDLKALAEKFLTVFNSNCSVDKR